MNEFHDRLKIVFLYRRSPEAVINIEVNTNSRVSFNEKNKRTDAGVQFDQSLKTIIDKAGAEILEYYTPDSPVMVTIYNDEGSHIWGDSEVPVKMTITPHLNKYTLEFSRLASVPLMKNPSFL